MLTSFPLLSPSTLSASEFSSHNRWNRGWPQSRKSICLLPRHSIVSYHIHSLEFSACCPSFTLETHAWQENPPYCYRFPVPALILLPTPWFTFLRKLHQQEICCLTILLASFRVSFSFLIHSQWVAVFFFFWKSDSK